MSQNLSRRALLLGTSGFALRSALAAGRPIPIRVANAAGGLNLTMTALMQQQKYFEFFGLAPEMMSVSDGSKILAGIVGGSVDISLASGFGQVFPAVEHGAGLKILGGGAL